MASAGQIVTFYMISGLAAHNPEDCATVRRYACLWLARVPDEILRGQVGKKQIA